MIVCKITIMKEPALDYNTIFQKILSLGDFIVTAADNVYEVYYASDLDEVDADYIRKILRKHKVEHLIYTYNTSDKLDFDAYVNQWIATNLDRQVKIKIEREQQPQLKEVQRKLVLLDKVVDEMINARDRYLVEAQRLQEAGENQQTAPANPSQ